MESSCNDNKEIEDIFTTYLSEPFSVEVQEGDNAKVSTNDPLSEDVINDWLGKLLNPTTRDAALAFLCKHRFSIPNLASILWNSFGVVTSFVYDISTSFVYVVTSTMESTHCKRICNELALIHLMAINPSTRPFLLKANLPIFLYPLVRSTSKSPQFDYIRLSCVIILSALVAFDDPETTAYVLSTELIPLCLSSLESDRLLCTIVATKTIGKLLSDEVGLQYTCNTYDRFSRIVLSLSRVTNHLKTKPSLILLKLILKCFCSLTNNSMAVLALSDNIPTCLIDGTFDDIAKDDDECKRMFKTLAINVSNLPSSSDRPLTLRESTSMEKNVQDCGHYFDSVNISH